MSDVTTYKVPDGPLRLAGPVVRPKQGTLPLRGDLAHIALAGRYLAAHYVIPKLRNISDVVTEIAAGTAIEVLDIAGEWAWVCLTPEGPSGYVRIAQLAPADA